jgi:sialic acid synthase
MSLTNYSNKSNKIFFIAEIGINHNGSLENAYKLIDLASQSGADAVKFQKRNVEESFTKEYLYRPYLNKNSFGSTYGEHKNFLEFSIEQHQLLCNYSHSLGLLYGCTACDLQSVDDLMGIDIDFFKISSGDLRSHPLIKKVIKTGKPYIISTGMCDLSEIYKSVSLCDSNLFGILSCTSSYPTPIEDQNLRVISTLISRFPEHCIGYSGHEDGIISTICAIGLGARVIERHITIDKEMKGGDHKGSLDPDELRFLIKSIRDLEKGLGDGKKRLMDSEKKYMEKLCKGVYFVRNMREGEIIREDDLCIKHPMNDIPASEYYNLIGKDF